MLKKLIKVLIISSSILILGCASKASKIKASYVSDFEFNHLNCKALRRKLIFIQRKAVDAASTQDQIANDDQSMGLIGTFLFWPSYFFIDGDGSNATTLARLKGERDSIQQVMLNKNCGYDEAYSTPKFKQNTVNPILGIYGIMLGEKYSHSNSTKIKVTEDGWKIITGLPIKPSDMLQNTAGILENDNGIYTIVVPSVGYEDDIECRKSQRKIVLVLNKKYGKPSIKTLTEVTWEGQYNAKLLTAPQTKIASDREIELQFCEKEASSKFVFRIVYYDKTIAKSQSKSQLKTNRLESNL